VLPSAVELLLKLERLPDDSPLLAETICPPLLELAMTSLDALEPTEPVVEESTLPALFKGRKLELLEESTPDEVEATASEEDVTELLLGSTSIPLLLLLCDSEDADADAADADAGLRVIPLKLLRSSSPVEAPVDDTAMEEEEAAAVLLEPEVALEAEDEAMSASMLVEEEGASVLEMRAAVEEPATEELIALPLLLALMMLLVEG
jgi:hypothetical protein